MLLLASGYAGAYTDGLQHDVSIQISINLGKNAVTQILARCFADLLSFFSQILIFIFWRVLIFISINLMWSKYLLIIFQFLDLTDWKFVAPPPAKKINVWLARAIESRQEPRIVGVVR